MNLAALLLEHPFGDEEGLLHTVDRTVTAGEARAAARATAERLGPLEGRAVAVQLPNTPEFVTVMAAIWLAGGVLVPVNARLPEPERERILATTGAAALVTADDVEPLDGRTVYPDGSAFIMWTSGTTGAPKPILHSHDAYLELLDRVLGPLRAKSAALGPAEAAQAPSPNLIPVSLALNAGLYNALFGLRAGAALVIMDRFDTATFAELVHRFAIRSTVLPPAAIAMLNDDIGTDTLGPLKYVRSITAPLSPLQARRFADRFGITVLNGYGQAETGEVIGWTAADARAHPEKIGAVGRPHPGVDIRIAGAGPRELGRGEVGRLLVRPPRTALGIEDRVDADGFIDTGDLASIDADGFVWLEGRAGDVINRGGHKVFPGHVEEVLCLSPAIAEAAVVGVPDDRLGEVPVAIYVGSPVADSELEALCRQHLAPYKVPVAFHRVDALPRNEVGKVLRRELAERFSAARS